MASVRSPASRPRSKNLAITAAFFFSLWLAGAVRGDTYDYFEKHIRPVLVERCYKCHSAGSKDLKGDLLLDTREGMLKGGDSGKPAIVPGDPEKSLLIHAIRHESDELKMPPKEKLTEQQIQQFVEWIRAGAPDPRTGQAQPSRLAQAEKHWAFQPPKSHPIPAVKAAQWPQTPIDHFILARLEEKDLEPAPRADKRTLIRRAYYDLTGLPPTIEEVEAFENDHSPNAFEKVVDRLLDSPRYGERYGRYWLDIARFSDTKGYVYGGEETRTVHSHVYRDWVIRAFNDDMPYDKFIMQQLAADQLNENGEPVLTPDPSAPPNRSLAGMGYLTLGRRFLGVLHDIIDDRIDVVTRGMLGLTVSCARCHDHKFDPIPTRDYYSLYGVFASSTERTVSLVASPEKTEAYLAYEKEMQKRVQKLDGTFLTNRMEMTDRLRKKAAEYLVAVLDAEKLPSDDFVEILGPDDINPRVVRDWQNYIFQTRKGFHPVFAPWHALADLNPKDFAENSARILDQLAGAKASKPNPLVLEALRSGPLQSMRDVAERYGKLFTGIDQKWREALKKAEENKSSPPAALPDSQEEEIRDVLYGTNAIARVPPGTINDLEFFFDERTWRNLKILQAEIDRWIIQSPGAPSHAVILEDQPVAREPRVFIRGNPATKGDFVPRQFLKVLAGESRKPFAIGSGRLELAQAIASRDNPLTARVMVNRLWLAHFGQGLVRTPSDFGTRCDPPSHPELLDWLAVHFMDQGWSMKKVHRLVMLSSVYQQASVHPDETEEPSNLAGANLRKDGRPKPSIVDPENRLLWRMNRRRLDFEAMRDSLLAASGELNLQLGGLSVDLNARPFSGRRTVYGFIDRQFVPGMLRVFDFANPDAHSPQRYETTISPQALFFINSPFVVERARAVAARPDLKALEKPEDRIERLYKLLYQRSPTPRQKEAGIRFIENCLPEPKPEPPKLTAWRYGYGEYDPQTQRMKSFADLPFFDGDAWQGGSNWPDAKLGWVRLTSEGGHAGNDAQHAAVRRWISPFNGKVNISGTIKHIRPQGDGVQARIVSSRLGQLQLSIVHNREASASLGPIEVKEGDTIDFVVDRRDTLDSDDFTWMPVIKNMAEAKEGTSMIPEWNAKKEFAGPSSPTLEPLSPWEKYAQALLMLNEFYFVD